MEFVRLDGERLTLLTFEPVNSPERTDRPTPVDIGSETSERLEVLEHEWAKRGRQITLQYSGVWRGRINR